MNKPELIELSAKEWGEVYYALSYKLVSPAVIQDSVWIEELQSIMDRIAEHVTV